MNRLRPCLVKSKEKNVQAFFHKFFTEAFVVEPSPMASGGQYSEEFALVEYADGSVHKVYSTQIHFLDAKLRIALNRDADKVKKIQEAVEANEGYCPCELDKIPETKCMCKSFINQNEPGPCHCGLYVKEVCHE